jgi:hypothetical protein
MHHRYQVITQEPGYVVVYDGSDAADAMAAWSKAISEGEVGYVTLEALRINRPKEA